MYKISKSPKRITSADDKVWNTAETLFINQLNWDEYQYCPETTAKLLFSDYGIHVRMHTDESPLLARYTDQNDPVCTDSCMELFISPNEGDDRYINMEFNPFGTMYLAIRTSRFDASHPEEDKAYFEVSSSVDRNGWTLSFTIPFEFIDRNFGKHTKNMRGNVYKCREDGTPEHYVSLFPIDTPKPDFQRSEFFGNFMLAE